MNKINWKVRIKNKMNKINWKVRIKNKQFWVTLVPAVLLLIQVIAVPFGYNFKLDVLNKQLLDVINALFVILTILGVVNDPTTHSLKDSQQALTYQQPKNNN